MEITIENLAEVYCPIANRESASNWLPLFITIKTKSMDAAHVTVNRKKEVNISGYTNGVQEIFIRLKRWDMKYITQPKKQWCLTYEQNQQFLTILSSRAGRELENKLLNEKTDKILNEFLEMIKSSIPKDEYKAVKGDHQKLVDFFEECKNTPLQGINGLRPKIVGLSKKELWEAMVYSGLVKSLEHAHKETGGRPR